MIAKERLEHYFDTAIRCFLYLLILWIPFSEGVIESCVITALVLWIVKRVMLRKWTLPHLPVSYAILAFIVSCIFSVVLSDYFSQSWHNFLTKTMEWFVIFFLVLEVFQTKKQLYFVLGLLLVTSSLVWADSIQQYHISGRNLFEGHKLTQGTRATGSFEAANGLGAYWTFLIPFLFVLSLKRKYVMLFTGLFLWSMILTFSRGAWAGLAGGMLVSFYMLEKFYFDRKKVWRRFRISFMVFIVCILSLVVSSRISINQLNRSSSWRLSMWGYSFNMVKEKPFFGHGINTYMKLFQSYRPKHVGIYDHYPTYAHNCFLQVLCETGAFGLLTFLGIFVMMGRSVFRALKDIHQGADPDMVLMIIALSSGGMGYLIHSFFDTHFYSLKLSSYFWVMAGLLAASCQILKHNEMDNGYGKT